MKCVSRSLRAWTLALRAAAADSHRLDPSITLTYCVLKNVGAL
ncbi:hypothetical protein AA0113_g7721 [Alternaria arborescens]|uniref:Uncharacterized protein n=1 Tax=Alternaria arborescens TaxID=156630 RepID=A0A4Q4RNP7_9PLEO|nr:hypothetical protein AA0111_g7362 [Alternaria arborescens]RYO27511.1 hypothetical protein AA0111_g7362 [Alternaria arborescens]RYO58592.1 hypothetical protein AA0113_g7721 [Alternaria arborescens]